MSQILYRHTYIKTICYLSEIQIWLGFYILFGNLTSQELEGKFWDLNFLAYINTLLCEDLK